MTNTMAASRSWLGGLAAVAIPSRRRTTSCNSPPVRSVAKKASAPGDARDRRAKRRPSPSTPATRRDVDRGAVVAPPGGKIPSKWYCTSSSSSCRSPGERLAAASSSATRRRGDTPARLCTSRVPHPADTATSRRRVGADRGGGAGAGCRGGRARDTGGVATHGKGASRRAAPDAGVSRRATPDKAGACGSPCRDSRGRFGAAAPTDAAAPTGAAAARGGRGKEKAEKAADAPSESSSDGIRSMSANGARLAPGQAAGTAAAASGPPRGRLAHPAAVPARGDIGDGDDVGRCGGRAAAGLNRKASGAGSTPPPPPPPPPPLPPSPPPPPLFAAGPNAAAPETMPTASSKAALAAASASRRRCAARPRRTMAGDAMASAALALRRCTSRRRCSNEMAATATLPGTPAHSGGGGRRRQVSGSSTRGDVARPRTPPQARGGTRARLQSQS